MRTCKTVMLLHLYIEHKRGGGDGTQHQWNLETGDTSRTYKLTSQDNHTKLYCPISKLNHKSSNPSSHTSSKKSFYDLQEQIDTELEQRS